MSAMPQTITEEKPPSTGIAIPVTKSEAWLARKIAPPLRSSGSPHRPAGVLASTFSFIPDISFLAIKVSSVLIKPGKMAFT